MTDIMQEIRMSRAFAVAFYDALTSGKIQAPKEVLESFAALKKLYDDQMTRELS